MRDACGFLPGCERWPDDQTRTWSSGVSFPACLAALLVLVLSVAAWWMEAAAARAVSPLHAESSTSVEAARHPVDTDHAGSESELSSFDAIRCVWNIEAEASSSQPPSWTTLFRIAEINASCGIRATGRRYAKPAMTERPPHKTADSEGFA